MTNTHTQQTSHCTPLHGAATTFNGIILEQLPVYCNRFLVMLQW